MIRGNLGPASGPAELELASLLAFIKNNDIRNVVWVTGDVHYTSATLYGPGRASFTDFTPFDRTFGPDVRYSSAPLFRVDLSAEPTRT